MHLTQKQLEDYSRQQLRVAELLSLSEHLGECEECRRQIESSMDGDATFFALRSEVFEEPGDIASSQLVGAHLTAEEMAGYVDRTLSSEGLQIVADHLTCCEPCAVAVDDLRAFRNEIAPLLDREYHPASTSSPTEGGWRQTLTSLTGLFRVFPVPAFGAALGILLLTGTGWLIWRTVREREPKHEIVVSPAPAPEPALVVPNTQPPTVPALEPRTVVAQLNDGEGLLTLDQEGKLSGTDDLPLAYQSLVKKALTTGRVEKSSKLNGLNRQASSLMSSDNPNDKFSVIEPVGNVLMTNQPTFRWSPLEGASGYVVEVYDNNFKLVTTSPQLPNYSWALPQSLPPGQVYSWQVKAIKEGQEITSPRPPAPQAKFRILDQAKANELAKARRAYASSHLALGLLYADAGLLKESEGELRILQKANPDSDLARKLLRHVQALRRRNE
jgi:hypothetical protein